MQTGSPEKKNEADPTAAPPETAQDQIDQQLADEKNASAAMMKEGSLSHNLDDDEDGQPKLSPRSQCKQYTDQFLEMIEYMDFKFEAAFQQKDKEFMMAYRDHVQMIQAELNDLKRNCNDDVYMDLKKKKIESLEKKLE